MVRDDDLRASHDKIRDELKKQLTQSGISERQLSTELHIDLPAGYVQVR